MKDSFDKFLSDELKRGSSPVDEIHYKKIDDVLNNLPARKYKRYNYKAAIIIIACLTMSSTGVLAGVRSRVLRFNNIEKTDITRIDSLIQNSMSEADSYSRKLSVKEEYRLTEQIKRYEEGQFPRTEMPQVEQVSEAKKYPFCYCYENSMFYLPKDELTDEQMLQIVDFQRMRDYVLVASNEERSDSQSNEEKERDESSIEEDTIESVTDIAVKFLSIATNEDIKNAKITVKSIRNNELYSAENNYRVSIKTSENRYRFIINADNRYKVVHFECVNKNLNSQKDAIYSEEKAKEYIEVNKVIFRILENGKEPNKMEVSCLLKNSSVIKGRLTYYLYDDTDTGILVEYDINYNTVILAEYCNSFSMLKQADDRGLDFYKKKNKNYRRIRKELKI